MNLNGGPLNVSRIRNGMNVNQWEMEFGKKYLARVAFLSVIACSRGPFWLPFDGFNGEHVPEPDAESLARKVGQMGICCSFSGMSCNGPVNEGREWRGPWKSLFSGLSVVDVFICSATWRRQSNGIFPCKPLREWCPMYQREN